MLVVLDLDKKMRVEVDMLKYATREVLSMKCKDNKWMPVVFISKSLNKAERSSEIYYRKMLAIIHCLEE